MILGMTGIYKIWFRMRVIKQKALINLNLFLKN